MSARWHAMVMAGARPTRDPDRAFDAHVLACVLGVALDEVERGVATLAQATGLDGATLAALADCWFPDIAPDVLSTDDPAPPLEIEEEMLRDLLIAHGRGGMGLDGAADLPPVLARMIARRALRPDHLWQDLGLFDRSELNRLLARHFPTLAAGNTGNMRWKKYLYRKLCEAEGFSLCAAPSCAQCADFRDCFGAEDGESRMAETRRSLDRAGLALAAE